MVRLILVSDLEVSGDDIKQIYIHSFPSDERREWHQLKELLRTPNFRLNRAFKGDQFIGFIILWNLPGFVFIEHFAIVESFQGKGIGTEVLKHTIKANTGKVILEVEVPSTESTRRRIAFYERLGFSVCRGIYWQPPYSADKTKIKMLLMSYPDPIPPREFTEIKRHVYREVYQFYDFPDF